ncbi:hypothetical protein N2152v2_006752 [Parachlorella kessleri]
MGNSVSYCKEEPAVRVKEALGGESTEERGSDASNDATSPADTAPAVPMEPATAGAEAEHAAGDLMERAKETMVSAKEAAESALETAVDRAHLRKGSPEGAPAATSSSSGEEEAAPEPETPAGSEEEVPAPGMKTVTLRTAANDPRFPITNQTRHCYVAYNEYYKCVRDRGEDNQACAYIKRQYRSLCPDEWVARWEELREAGTWYGKY